MDAVKGAGEDEIVVGVELLESRRKVAVVDESTGLVDDEQCEDDPGREGGQLCSMSCQALPYAYMVNCARLRQSIVQLSQ